MNGPVAALVAGLLATAGGLLACAHGMLAVLTSDWRGRYSTWAAELQHRSADEDWAATLAAWNESSHPRVRWVLPTDRAAS